MPFGFRFREDSRNHVLDGVQIAPWEGAILRGGNGRPVVQYSDTAVSCTKTTEPIEILFGIWTRVGPRKHVLGGVHNGATWRIPMTVHVRRRYGLLSNYFDRLLLLGVLLLIIFISPIYVSRKRIMNNDYYERILKCYYRLRYVVHGRGCNPHHSLWRHWWRHNSQIIRVREKRRPPRPMKSSELSNGENRIALRQLLQNRKLRHLWHHNLGSRWKLQKKWLERILVLVRSTI